MTKRDHWIARQALPMFLLMCIAVLLLWFFPPRHLAAAADEARLESGV